MAVKPLLIKLGVIGDKDAKQKVKGVESSLKGMARSAVSAGAAFFGARGLINGISTSIELAGIQEQAEKRLEVALGKRSQALLDQASALQQVTTFGDEAIIGVQASIAAFVDSEDQIKKATKATLDLSVAMGMDLKGSGDLIAKTLGSSTNALSRYGIQVEGAVGSSERLESLTKNVAKLFGGQAQAEAQTYAGRVEQLKNALGDMGENIGRIVIPVFEKLAPHLKTAIDFWTNYLDVGKDADDGQKALSSQMESINQKIQSQSELIDYISTESYGSLNMAQKRAVSNNITLEEQAIKDEELLLSEIDNLVALTEQKDKLINKEKEHLKVKNMGQVTDKSFLKFKKQEGDISFKIAEVIPKITDSQKILTAEKQKQLTMDLKSAALSGQSAMEAMKSVVRAETMEAIAGLTASILKTVPYPFNLILAAGAGGVASQAIDRNLAMVKGFADGGIVEGTGTGDTVPAMLTPGELILNKAQQDNLSGGMGGITINIGGNIIGEESFVRDTLIPEIERARTLA